MQNISVTSSKSRRTIYSNFVYPTGNVDNRRPGGDLKSASFSGFADELNGRLASLDRRACLDRGRDSSTQTSKTILELAQIESGSMSPDSLNVSPKAKTMILRNTNTQTSVEALDSSEGYASCENDRVFDFVESRSSQPPPNSANPDEDDDDYDLPGVTVVRQQRRPKERCATPFFVETHHPNFVPDAVAVHSRPVTPSNSSERVENAGKLTATTNSSSVSSSSPRSSTRGVKTSTSTTTTPPVVTYMAPTISSENKNAQNVIRRLNRLFDRPRQQQQRGRSSSPRFAGASSEGAAAGVPYVERSVSTVSYDASRCARQAPSSKSSVDGSVGGSSVDYLFDKETLKKGSDENIILSCENLMCTPLAKIKDPDWNTCIQGLAEIIDCCRMADLDQIYPHMTIIYQKLIELLRSPRSHVCRTACQAAGNLFEFVRDTRRPEFDEVVDLLLFKTADANKFIRQDANLALDCMVTHIPTAHAVRALCSKGPAHKNHLVRTATVRLIVCAVVIAGPDNVLNPSNSEQTRKKIFYHMPKFVEDKNLEVRKFGERLYKVLSKEFRFDLYLKKYLDKEEVLNMKKNIRNMMFKS